MEVYMDNSATTKPYREAVEETARVMSDIYGNPSSLHSLGKAAEDSLKGARRIIADTLSCTEKEIIFTSGGTESDALAIIGAATAMKRRGNKLITQKTEHMAVLETFRYLETQGFEVYYADVGRDGCVNADDVISHIDNDTILVSIMHVNNETGAVMPLERIAKAIDKQQCLFHSDAVQSYGKTDINPARMGIDLLSVSSHKIHGPNGVGALYVRNGVRLNPVLHGGKQESGLRSGTENLAGICGFAMAAQIRFSNMDESQKHISALRDRLTCSLTGRIDNVTVISPREGFYPIINVAFEGIKSEVLLHILESKGIYVSTGSACNSKKKLNYVLKAMDIRDSIIDGAIRFSLSEFNTEQEVDYVADVLSREVPLLRKIMR